ncbi:hypothetical protein AWC11_22385 [Mycobacterium interjectum]|nr:hypothetical protein AWC11_22385 [Mycobacterium interjectum]
MTTPHDTTTAFDAIVASFSEYLHCEMPTHAGGRCLRLARWRLDLHGCEQMIMCGHHKESWLRRMRNNRQHIGPPRCARCRVGCQVNGTTSELVLP